MSNQQVPEFLKKNLAPEQEQATTQQEAAAPQQEAAAPQAAAPQAAEKKEKKERKPKAKEMTTEDIDFVLQNIKTKSYTEMAEERGLTKHQVNRVLMDTKKRLRSQYAEGTPEREKIEEYIKTELSRPEDSKPGAGGGKSSKVKGALDGAADDILGKLGIK